jgi:hypothetical protein
MGALVAFAMSVAKRLNLIEEQLAELDYAKTAGFLVNGRCSRARR